MQPAQTDKLISKYYRAADGTEPVREFINLLPPNVQVAIENNFGRIDELCTLKKPDLPFPYSSQIEGELRELRIQALGSKYRVLYRHSHRFVILLHIFRKSTDKMPELDKKIARERWNDFRSRMDAEPRTPPSPIGVGRIP